jgi:transmembrane sensor
MNIDFEIIWKKIHTSLSEEEEELFKSWLEENSTHREFVNKVSRYYNEGSGFKKNPAEVKKSWNKVYKAISINKAKRTRRIVYALSITAGMVIFIIILLLKPGQREKLVFSDYESIIKPGSKQATLILDNGSAYKLTEETDLSLEDGGTLINTNGKALEYIDHSKETDEMKFNTLSTPRGGEFFLILSDGTMVWLNSETSLRYPVQFTGKNRIVELEGEAFFEVARDDKRPFKVITGEQVLEVLGTSFNLSSYPDEDFVYTTLVEGKVCVFLEAYPEISQNLMPSYQSCFKKGSMNISQVYVNVNEFIAWKDGIFSFRNQDLARMMKTVSRWYDLEIQFENIAAMYIKFTGEIKRYENFEKILALIEKTNEVTFEIDGNSVTVK